MDGILCLDKPQDITSFVCCAKLRRLVGEKKVGHGGTLDPMATGVLPILFGKATRALDLIPAQDKRYVATLRFGFVSETLDIWGEVTPTGKPVPTLSEIESALPSFRGDILQIPPMTSALKQQGQRLYTLARQGITVDRPARPVTVFSLDILQYDPDKGELTIDCHCSKGTYIRTICDDLGAKLGCGAVMIALRRTRAAGLPIEQAVELCKVEELAASDPEGLKALVRPIEDLFTDYPAVTVSAKQAVRFRNGGALEIARLSSPVSEGLIRVKDPDGVFLGLGEPKDGSLKIVKLFV